VKVLIADDSIVSRHLLNATLSKWGYEVVLASDGDQAWEILQEPNPPNLAILDWMMPGMTGLEVCRRVRQRAREPHTYILLLTSKSLKEDLIQGMESGADDYIVKPFDQHELNVRLRSGTRWIKLQTELLTTREALREQATKDSLTRVWNRSSILENLAGELARADREPRPLGVVLVDLDDFKTVNDTHGHYAGDIVLQEAAKRMRGSIRKYDSIGRYGGEEFLILLPGCDELTTFAQAERLRTYLADEKIVVPTASIALTASFGCTSAPPNSRISADTLIRKADDALYLAKRRGRNRVELLSSAPPAKPVAPPPLPPILLEQGTTPS
jgi:two-component system cell cycle response regulator